MLRNLVARSRRLAAIAALCAAVVVPALTPKPAQAWWGPFWRWHAGIAVPFPPVVVGAPVYPVPAYYPPYAPAYAYAPYWRWVPAYRAANGVIIGGHWEH